VRLGIESSTSNTRGSKEEGTSYNDYSDGPVGQYIQYPDGGLLSTVREVIVSAGHVVERSGFTGGQVHLDSSSIKVGSRSSIQLHAISDVCLGSIGIIVVER